MGLMGVQGGAPPTPRRVDGHLCLAWGGSQDGERGLSHSKGM